MYCTRLAVTRPGTYDNERIIHGFFQQCVQARTLQIIFALMDGSYFIFSYFFYVLNLPLYNFLIHCDTNGIGQAVYIQFVVYFFDDHFYSVDRNIPV